MRKTVEEIVGDEVGNMFGRRTMIIHEQIQRWNGQKTGLSIIPKWGWKSGLTKVNPLCTMKTNAVFVFLERDY